MPHFYSNWSMHTGGQLAIDPFHARHSIAVTVVMYHMTYERWRSSKKTRAGFKRNVSLSEK